MRYCREPEVRTHHASAFANFGFKSGTRIIALASVPLIPKFAFESAARMCELRNRDTSSRAGFRVFARNGLRARERAEAQRPRATAIDARVDVPPNRRA